MVVLLAAVAVGLLVRVLRGTPLASLELRWRTLVVLAVIVQTAGAVAPYDDAYSAGLVLSGVLAGAFLVLNRGVQGLGLIALGFLSNALAVVANSGRMPVDPLVAGRAGVDTLGLLTDGRHKLGADGTPVHLLTDVIAVPAGPLSGVLSVGDVAVAAGVLLLLAVGRTPPREPGTPQVVSPRSRRASARHVRAGVLPDAFTDPRTWRPAPLEGTSSSPGAVDDEQITLVGR